ncbi:TPA: hypothetical protein ACGCBI_002842 [Serratia marcescens]
MTLTTERQQFEQWWETAMHNGYPPRFGWEHWRDGDGYRDDDGEFQGLWQAWQASRELLANREAQPVGYFVRHRSVWDKMIMWKPWTECSAEDYAEYCKRIATGEADAGRFYDARILYDAPPKSNAADWGINMQTGTPILTYKNCCVIESEQAHYVLSLINNAAPAPAVPDESDPRDAFESVFPMPKYVVRCGTGYAVTAYSAWGAHDFKERWEGWNACRAAMLAQPVSQRYTFNSPVIPDGWKLVPVEPTEDMLRAAYRESGVYSAKAYRAMLAAAQEGGK